MAQVFALEPQGFNLPRAIVVLAVFLVPLIVLGAIDKEQYFLSAAFGALFVGLVDPGGAYGYRVTRMAAFALMGAAVTVLGFWIASAAWGWVVLVSFAVTLAAGLTVKFGAHRFVAGLLLNIWFLIAIALPAGYTLDHVTSYTWAQALAWLAGAALWIAVTWVGWLARGRKDRPQPMPEIPGDISPRELTRPLVAYAVLRAVALAIAVAIPFGLQLPNADWMPVAALVAMKPSLAQSALIGEQRLAGAFIGAVLAALVLLTIDNRVALEVIMIVVFTLGGAIRYVNYALYCAAIAAGVLIGMDLPHPSDLAAEGRRVLYTFIGVGIGVLVMLVANLLAKRSAPAPPPAARPA